MNPSQHRTAVRRLLDIHAPDVHIEVLLLFGVCPDRWEFNWECDEWEGHVRNYLADRYGYSLTKRLALATCCEIIIERIAKEAQQDGR